MKKQKKILVPILVFLTMLLLSCNVFATTNVEKYNLKMEFSEEFKKYMDLSEEERQSIVMPRMYNIPKSEITTKNPFRIARRVGTSTDLEFSLKDIIPENMVIKNQGKTNSCWTFSSLATLETTLAMKNYKNNLAPIVYDFSERHMEYATSQSFIDGTNEMGFNRQVGSGGHFQFFVPYLINGTGAIAEADLPFESNEEKIYLSEIQDKTVLTQVNDITTFPSYDQSDDLTQIKQQMKEHIQNYGAIDAVIHGASPIGASCYNNETGALYCNHTNPDHAVAIVGWDDDYAVENFTEGNRPTNKGAWIIKNSWGTETERISLQEMKDIMFNQFQSQCEQQGWTDATLIPDENAKQLFEANGYTIENNEAFIEIGKDGFMYVSYEDVNIYLQLTAITNAQYEIEYENIYQYDEFDGYMSSIMQGTNKMYLGTIFDKKTTASEYLTQVALRTSEKVTCKVYVNPNGASKAKDDLQLVELKNGESETFDAGYHTLEFANPIKINASSFVVIIECQGYQDNQVTTLMEFNSKDFAEINSSYEPYKVPEYDNVKIESGKCFITNENGFNQNQWDDTSTLATLTQGGLPNFDTTVKAFTVSNAGESIEITTPPTKTKYFVGEDFDPTGMVVKLKKTNGKLDVITDYTISNGTNLQLGQTSVTISYNGKTATQDIEVVENTLESLIIECAPTKTTYMAGEDFEPEGMLVLGIYADGTSKTINDYSIDDGTNLKNGQTSVTISYEGKTVTQAITVQPNPVVEIAITHEPDKVDYVAGQNFDATGMVVKATYESGMEKEITDYTVQDGEDLEEGQTSVTIEYEGQTTTQAITVVAKTIESITIKTMPSKTQYIQNKEELDLTGGVIVVAYNDGTSEEVAMTSTDVTASGFDNTEVGSKTITLTYEGITVQFNVEIIEEPKPENSNFDNMQGNVSRIRTYSFTDLTKEAYIVINVELSNIIKSTVNDNMEYYYYVSANPNEANIVDWVKIDSLEQTTNGIAFEINTLDITNLDEAVNGENLYLYVKEVAIRNGMQQELTTSAIELASENINIETYVDGEKVDEIDPDDGSSQGGQNDPTLAPGTIPHAGKSLLIVCLILAVMIIGRFAYLRYRDIQIK